MTTRKLTKMALLTAVALIIFMVEAQIPNPVAIPGVKLGLANVVTVYALFALGWKEALMILVARVFLGSVFSGQMMTFFYALGGGLLCLASMAVLKKFVTEKQMWACSALGAVFHNLGQLIVAAFITKTAAVFAYLPLLIVSGILTGLFTGVAAQAVFLRLKKIGKN